MDKDNQSTDELLLLTLCESMRAQRELLDMVREVKEEVAMLRDVVLERDEEPSLRSPDSALPSHYFEPLDHKPANGKGGPLIGTDGAPLAVDVN